MSDEIKNNVIKEMGENHPNSYYIAGDGVLYLWGFVRVIDSKKKEYEFLPYSFEKKRYEPVEFTIHEVENGYKNNLKEECFYRAEIVDDTIIKLCETNNNYATRADIINFRVFNNSYATNDESYKDLLEDEWIRGNIGYLISTAKYSENAYKFLADINIEYFKLENALTILKDLTNNTKGMKGELSNSILELNQEKKKLSNAISKELAELDIKKKELEEFKAKFDDEIERVREYARIASENKIPETDNLIQYNKLQSNKNRKTEWNYNCSLADFVWYSLWNREESLKYDRSVVSRFIMSLNTDQITILWGDPGSGKTTLPNEVAKEIGAECVTISVQPNWTDNQDLLGFYNHLEKNYSSTEFLDALIDAGNNPEKLYIILLDEMNLAHIEYYFAAVLSAITKKKEDRYLHLYSSNGSVKCNIPPKILIPSNVRFVGTLNMDQTTKFLSPKVIDRSYLINVFSLGDIGKKHNEEYMDSLREEMQEIEDGSEINASYFVPKKYQDVIVDDDTTEIVKTIMNNMNELLALKSAEAITKECVLSNRYESFVRQMVSAIENNSVSIINVDDLIVDKILPVVHFFRNQLEDINISSEEDKKNHPILKFLVEKDYEKAKEKVMDMLSEAIKHGESYYWKSVRG